MNPDRGSVTGADLRLERPNPHAMRCDAAVSEPELLLPDVPLIVEDLLWQARHLADLGAPIETVNAILDHVVAVREGRG